MPEKTSPSKMQKDRSSHRRWWKLLIGIVLLLAWTWVAIIISQLVVGFFMVQILGPENVTQPLWTAVYSALAYILAMVLIIFAPLLFVKEGKRLAGETLSCASLGLRGLPTWSDIGLALIGFVVYLFVAAGITAIFSFFPWFNATELQNVGFDTYIFGFDRIIAFITLVVVAPVAEEIIFRGWLYGKMRTRLNTAVSNKVSIVISALLVSILFGIIHGQWNVGVNVFALSLVLCGLREITGTIHAGILVHMLKNGVAFYLLYVLGMV